MFLFIKNIWSLVIVPVLGPLYCFKHYIFSIVKNPFNLNICDRVKYRYSLGSHDTDFKILIFSWAVGVYFKDLELEGETR